MPSLIIPVQSRTAALRHSRYGVLLIPEAGGNFHKGFQVIDTFDKIFYPFLFYEANQAEPDFWGYYDIDR